MSFKKQVKLLAASNLAICVLLGSAIAAVMTPIVGPLNQQQVVDEISQALCWHNGMGPADLCDPFFDTNALELANFKN